MKANLIRFCKQCGKEHNTGLENTETGEFELLDNCKDCTLGNQPIRCEWEGNLLCYNSEGEIVNMAEELNKRERLQ